MDTLLTERIKLRGFKKSDLEDLYKLCTNPKIGPDAGWEPHKSRMQTSKILGNFVRSPEVWAMELREDGRVVGSISFSEDAKRNHPFARVVGFFLEEELWGKGLMTEAVREVIRYSFEEVGLEVLSVYHYPYNTGSQRVIEKCGFSYEGVLRAANRRFDGKMFDEVAYSITVAEYLTRLVKGRM